MTTLKATPQLLGLAVAVLEKQWLTNVDGAIAAKLVASSKPIHQDCFSKSNDAELMQ